MAGNNIGKTITFIWSRYWPNCFANFFPSLPIFGTSINPVYFQARKMKNDNLKKSQISHKTKSKTDEQPHHHQWSIQSWRDGGMERNEWNTNVKCVLLLVRITFRSFQKESYGTILSTGVRTRSRSPCMSSLFAAPMEYYTIICHQQKRDKLGATNKTAVAVWLSSSSVPRSSPCCHGT